MKVATRDTGTTTAGTRIAYNDDWVGPGTNQVPDWSGNDALLAGGTTLHLAAGDYCIQATSWNDGTYNYMNGGYYLLSNIPLNTPTTGHYVEPPTVGDIPDQQRPENFGTYNYDVHSYFVDTPGGGLVYQLGSTIYMDGLTLDAQTGIITGAVARAGTHRVKLTAKNAVGEASREFRIAVGNQLALTPPMGWNSWYIHYHRVSDKVMRQAADQMIATGMADYGYQYVNIDDCWMVKVNSNDPEIGGPTRAAEGRLLSNKRFPDSSVLTINSNISSASSAVILLAMVSDAASFWRQAVQFGTAATK